MIHIETICDNMDTFRIERQRNSPKDEWYGISLSKSDEKTSLADNPDWIIGDLYLMLTGNNTGMGMHSLGLEWDGNHAEFILKLIRKAYKLGWFDDLIVNP